MNTSTKQHGFTLLEMLIALSITIGLTGVLFSYLKYAQNTFVTEGAVSDMNQNFRAAIDLISRDIQAAGAGVPLFLGPIAGKQSRNWTGGNDSDRILILYGDPTGTAVPVKTPSTGTPLPTGATSYIYTDIPATAYQTNRPYLLYTVAQRQDNSANVSDYAEFSIFTLADTNAISDITGGKRLTPTPWALNTLDATTWDHTVAFPSSSALRVIPLDEVVEYMVDKTNRTLKRNRTNGGWIEVARGIEDLDFQYLIETFDSATQTYNSTWVDEPLQSGTNNRALIRSVRFTLKGRTQLQADVDKQGQRYISQTVEVAPRNLVLPGFVPNR